MKNYFADSCARAFSPLPYGRGPWSASGSERPVDLPATAANSAAAGEVEQQLAVLKAIQCLVQQERELYQEGIRRSSRREYCGACEKKVVKAEGELRCPSCSVWPAGASDACSGVPASACVGAFTLLPDAYNPNRGEEDEEQGSPSVCRGGSGDLSSGVCTPRSGGVLTQEFLLHAFGAGIETSREEEVDERPAVWCHQKNCRNDSDLKGLLICSKCRRCFHASCCEPPLNFDMVTRFPWQCADCKICEICLSNKNEETMLICDACDRAFHMECLSPPVLQDISCFYSNRSRICPECKERYLRVKRGRAVLHGTQTAEGIYAACSKKNSANKLCEVCVEPLECEGKGASKRVYCVDCRIGVHKGCTVPGAGPNEFICHICKALREEFTVGTEIAPASP
ncbi:phd-finger domain-containing protein [Cyclospora cayetanensis]|uniref:Phd-finger domain-containing protein n=1 Tax=Cyclospora cayetanensis TaxID=88456 RepID=A0A1D3D828_9EIME|nr:phd-finger domain-containing protein [Cyclospora cayetanensis]